MKKVEEVKSIRFTRQHNVSPGEQVGFVTNDAVPNPKQTISLMEQVCDCCTERTGCARNLGVEAGKITLVRTPIIWCPLTALTFVIPLGEIKAREGSDTQTPQAPRLNLRTQSPGIRS